MTYLPFFTYTSTIQPKHQNHGVCVCAQYCLPHGKAYDIANCFETYSLSVGEVIIIASAPFQRSWIIYFLYVYAINYIMRGGGRGGLLCSII